MEIVIIIDAPNLGVGFGRAEQTQRGIINKMLNLLGSRIELGQSEGSITGNGGCSARWKAEQSVSAPAAEASGAA